MAERLTDEELGEVDVLFKDEDDLVFRPTMNHKLDRFFTLFVKLLTEVRERREQDATHLKHAEAAVQLHARCELLEACLREPTAEEKAFALDRWRLERLESDIAADDREDADEQRKVGRRKEEVPKFRKPTAEEKAFALDRWRLERLESDIAADDREDADEQRKVGAT